MPPPQEHEPTRSSSRFSEFIRERKHDIIAVWTHEVRGLSKAAELDHPALVDHVPELLDQIAEIADDLVAGEQPMLPVQVAEKHALERLDEGFDLAL